MLFAILVLAAIILVDHFMDEAIFVKHMDFTKAAYTAFGFFMLVLGIGGFVVNSIAKKELTEDEYEKWNGECKKVHKEIDKWMDDLMTNPAYSNIPGNIYNDE